MLATAVFAIVLAQDPETTAVRAAQARRVATMARCAQSVCSVMDMTAPGGGSGVIFDPHGFVLTNYHVVGEPDIKPEPPKEAPKKVEPKDGQLPVEPKEGEPGKPADPERPIEPKNLLETLEGKQTGLPQPPQPPAAELDAWKQAHANATEAEQQKFVADWQNAWRHEHWPKGKNHWRNKKVGLPDGQLYEAVVLGVDPGSDLAVLCLLPKSAGQTWPFSKLGDSDAMLVGETVFAMGNPFLLATDFTPTTTFGIVSGTHRYQEGQGTMLVYPDCLQVDAAVNPGNSGGPLFNEAGEVVGINGRISLGDRGRVNVGVGFAIASNQIANFLPDLIAGRHAEHGTLDLSAWYMTAPREETKRRGVFVQQMFKDSVAAAAGVSLGDEITSFNGEQVRSANQLATRIGVLPAGAWVTLGFKPALGEGGYGDEKVVTVRLSALDTGSSFDKKADSERLGSRVDRRLATQAFGERCTTTLLAEPVTFTLTTPNGTPLRFTRAGAQLRIDLGDDSYVRATDGSCFTVIGGKVADATADERAWLERELAANPFLWQRGDRERKLQEALLVGGAHVLGKAAYRFAVPGDGELEFWLLADGTPVGYALRDPVRKAHIERHVVGSAVRIIADGALETKWTSSGVTAASIDAKTFGRPQ